MERGRIDYAPDSPAVDYLSLRAEITARCPECGNSDCEHAIALAARAAEQYRERSSRERKVIEAAKEWAAHPETPKAPQDIPLYDTIDALLEFESKQK